MTNIGEKDLRFSFGLSTRLLVRTDSREGEGEDDEDAEDVEDVEDVVLEPEKKAQYKFSNGKCATYRSLA